MKTFINWQLVLYTMINNWWFNISPHNFDIFCHFWSIYDHTQTAYIIWIWFMWGNLRKYNILRLKNTLDFWTQFIEKYFKNVHIEQIILCKVVSFLKEFRMEFFYWFMRYNVLSLCKNILGSTGKTLSKTMWVHPPPP